MWQIVGVKPTVRRMEVAAFVIMVAVVTAPLQSQTIRGVVIDDSTSEEVAGAQVMLRDTLGRDVAQTISDSTGQFLFKVEPGQYTFRVVRLGYAPTVTTVLDATNVTDELNVVIRVPLTGTRRTDEPYALAPVIVEGRATDRYLAAFDRHRAKGLGDFVLREEFEKWNPQEVTDIIRRMSGFLIVPNKDYGKTTRDGSVDMRQYFIEVSSRPHRTRTPTECPPLIYLDGTSLGDAETIDITMIPVDALEAVETYARQIQMPSEYQRHGSECGVIALWTRAIEPGDSGSPFELGFRFGGGIGADSPGGTRLGFHLVTPFAGPVEFYASAHKIVSLRQGFDGIGHSGWQANIAGRVRVLTVGVPTYVGTGLVLLKPTTTIYGQVLTESLRIEVAHAMFVGVTYGLGPFVPFAEVQVLDPFKFSVPRVQTFFGVGLKL